MNLKGLLAVMLLSVPTVDCCVVFSAGYPNENSSVLQGFLSDNNEVNCSLNGPPSSVDGLYHYSCNNEGSAAVFNATIVSSTDSSGLVLYETPDHGNYQFAAVLVELEWQACFSCQTGECPFTGGP